MSDALRERRPDYGIDAPRVVRNLFLAGATGLVLWATAALGVWSGEVRFSIGGVRFVAFAANGCGEVRNVGSRISSAFLTLITFGSLRPATLVAKKLPE